MRGHTDSYQVYKRQVEEILDFAVLVCYSVPSLKVQLKVADEGKFDVPRPDFFIHDKNTTDGLRELTKDYRKRLGTFIWIAGFSYFESYIIGVIKEMITFHGGNEEFLARSIRRNQSFFHPTGEVLESKRKLQDARTPSKIQKYQKHSKILVDYDFRFPSDLFSSYGIKRLLDDIGKITPNEFPELLSSCLLFDMTIEQKERFHQIRDTRNHLVHRSKETVDFRQAVGANNDMHRLAAKIDKHMLEHFFIFEDYL